MPNATSVVLVWQAASDPATPAAQIVYEVFAATSPGAEDYAQPTWTTPPGATSFVTPGDAGPYFVVRARDGAGHVDDNTVERRVTARMCAAAQP